MEFRSTIEPQGVAVDIPFAKAAVRAVERAQVALATQCKDATDDAVESATQVKLLREFIFEEYGYHLADARKSTLEKLLESHDLPLDCANYWKSDCLHLPPA